MPLREFTRKVKMVSAKFKKMKSAGVLSVLIAALVVTVGGSSTAFAAKETYGISVSADGQLSGSGGSQDAAISPNGRYVVFTSSATNLTSTTDMNVSLDVFLRDRVTNTTELISVSPVTGEAANGSSTEPSVSADGRYVVFRSTAKNLHPNDAVANPDVYLRDRSTGTTTLISKAYDGGQATGDSTKPVIAANGSRIVFQSTAPNIVQNDLNMTTTDIFSYLMSNGVNYRISGGQAGSPNGNSVNPDVSDDGKAIAFASDATNLKPTDTNGSTRDVFVYYPTGFLGVTKYVSLDNDGSQSTAISDEPSISGDGRYIAFESADTDLNGGMSDNDAAAAVFVRDMVESHTERASVLNSGQYTTVAGYDPSISSDGKYVAFTSPSGLFAGEAGVSDGGATSDIFMRDLVADSTDIVSIASSGSSVGNGISVASSISQDGSQIVFESKADDLTSAVDPNAAVSDVFLRKVVPNTAPMADFSLTPASGNAPLNVSVDASASYDLDGQQLSYAWDFGDGSSGSGVQAAHTFNFSGTYTVTLTVTDDGGLESKATKQVTITGSSNSNFGGGPGGSTTGGGTTTATGGNTTATACLALSARAAKAKSLTLGKGLKAKLQITAPSGGKIGGSRVISAKLVAVGSKSKKKKLLKSIKQVTFTLNGKSAGTDRKSPYSVKLKNAQLKAGSNRLKVTVQRKGKKLPKRSTTLTVNLSKAACS